MLPLFMLVKKCMYTPVNTAARYTLPVFTGRVDGPCSQVVWTRDESILGIPMCPMGLMRIPLEWE